MPIFTPNFVFKGHNVKKTKIFYLYFLSVFLL